jgi:hypothetical protein
MEAISGDNISGFKKTQATESGKQKETANQKFEEVELRKSVGGNIASEDSTSMSLLAVRYEIYGKVQGVFFRFVPTIRSPLHPISQPDQLSTHK